jgi:chemotaxis protein CheC
VSAAGYTQEHQEALQEISNVAMGRAADLLARLLDRFVKLTVPHVQIIEARDAEHLRRVLGGEGVVSAARQAFSGRMRGEALVVFSGEGVGGLASLLGHEAPSPKVEQEVVLDVSNMLVGSCIGGIAKQLGHDIGYSPPSILGGQALASMLKGEQMQWSHAILMAVDFGVEGESFLCNLIALWPDEALLRLREGLDRFLETL